MSNKLLNPVILKSARDSPRPPGAALGRPDTGNNARRIGILFKSNFVEIIMEYDVK
jgi:hypothetical protein